nr:FCD domain-containing protein [Pseudomonas frederiksbergensis]
MAVRPRIYWRESILLVRTVSGLSHLDRASAAQADPLRRKRLLESQKLPFIRAERAMETWQEHRKILRALARRASGAAQKAMQEHVRNAALRTGVSFVTPAAA